MRLTADVIMHARASINPCDERELDLRGYKIPMIENLGVTQDQFDAIDFSDNEIKKLDNFPRYRRLSSLLLCNNHVSRIAADLGSQLPNLTCIILTNNKLNSLGDLDGLASCKKLTILSLLSNEVVNKQYYRLYVINLVPSLKQLDFQKVTVTERASASRLAASQAGQAMMKDVAKEKEKSNTFTPGGPAAAENSLTAEHRRIYAERIAAATTVEEVEMLTKKIQAGIVPSATYKQPAPVANGKAPAAPAPVGTAADPMDEAEEDKATEDKAVDSAAPVATAPVSGDQDSANASVASAEGGGVTPTPTPATAEAEKLPAAISAMDVQDGGEAMGGGDTESRADGTGNGDVREQGAQEGSERVGSAPAVSDAMDDGEGPGEAAGAAGGAQGEQAEPADDMVEEADEHEGEGVAGQEAGVEEVAQGGLGSLSAAEIKKYKVTELKEALADLKLVTSGKKADLQSRLLAAHGHQ